MSAAESRLKKELADVRNDDGTSGVMARPVHEGNVRELLGVIKGPKGTPYEGGVFRVSIVIPSEYPFGASPRSVPVLFGARARTRGEKPRTDAAATRYPLRSARESPCRGGEPTSENNGEPAAGKPRARSDKH